VRRARSCELPAGHQFGEPRCFKQLEGLALRLYIEVTANHNQVVRPSYLRRQLENPLSLSSALDGITFASWISKTVGLCNTDGSARLVIVDPESMSRPRARVVTVPVWRILLVHKVLGLANDGEHLVDECRNAPAGGNRLMAIPEDSLSGWAEEGQVFRQGAGHLTEQVGALREDVISVSVAKPCPIGLRALNNLLEAENRGHLFRQIWQKPVVQCAAPSVKRNNS
jgi:hypothetical protein